MVGATFLKFLSGNVKILEFSQNLELIHHVKYVAVSTPYDLSDFCSYAAENESAFDLLYCITFKLMDHQWLAMRASYMDFNVRVPSTC